MDYATALRILQNEEYLQAADLSVTHKRKKRQTFYILDSGNYVGSENRTAGLLNFMAPQAGLAAILTSLAYLVIDYLRPGTYVGTYYA